MVSFNDLNAAARLRETIKQVVSEVLTKERPAEQYATVISVSATNGTVNVQLPGESSNFAIPCGPAMPYPGSVVAIQGKAGTSHVSRILNGLVQFRSSLWSHGESEAIALIGNSSSARPYIAIYNQDASGNLDRKAYFGWPDAHSDTSNINVVSDQGSLTLLSSNTQPIILGPSDGWVHQGNHKWYSNASRIQLYSKNYAGSGGYPVEIGELYSEASVSAPSGYLRIGGAVIRFTDYGNTEKGNIQSTGFYLASGSTYYTYGAGGFYNNTYYVGIYSDQTGWLKVNNGHLYNANYIRTGSRYDFDGTGWKFTHSTDTDTGIYYNSDGNWALYSNNIPVASILGGEMRTYRYFSVYNSTPARKFLVAAESTDTQVIIDYYEATTTTADVVCDLAGVSLYIRYYSSSIEFKKDVEDLDSDFADKVLDLRPVWFRPNHKTKDPEDWSTYGFIAEEVAEVDPRLVAWKQPQECDCDAPNASIQNPDPDAEGWISNPDYKSKDKSKHTCLIPAGVQFRQITAMHTSVLRRQRDKIQALETENAELRSTLESIERRLVAAGL